MSIREHERHSLLAMLQQGRDVRQAALDHMDAERKIALFPVPFIANVAFGNPRFAARTAKRLMKRYDLPPAHTIEPELAALIMCSSDELQASVVKLGLLVILKQLPRLMKREDIETLNVVFGSSTVMFAMENRSIAPVWPHFILRLPENSVLHEQVTRYGWMALIHWVDNRYPVHGRWFLLRFARDFEPLKDSFPVVSASMPAVEKALESIFVAAQEKNNADQHHDFADNDDMDSFMIEDGMMQAEESGDA